MRLNVKDNQFVRKDELLYAIDERPYQYALENTVSEQATSGRPSRDEQRRISCHGECGFCRSGKYATAQKPGASERMRSRGSSGHAPSGLYANNNLHRLEPLLAKQICDGGRGGIKPELLKLPKLESSEDRPNLALTWPRPELELILGTARKQASTQVTNHLSP